ncbi:MAG TPA: arsenite methyltransferase [Saprospiraceae bacterium]|nr:arsenite methyltransferase [Saprospiraceae bacterium]
MEKNQEIKTKVIEIYSEIANQSKTENANSCCGVGGCSTVDHEVFAEDYSKVKGYVSDADLGLGCGIPTEFAQIKAGDVVLDLGSGAGNDCFVAREITGPSGKVIGVDMTPVMIQKARKNAEKLQFNNVEFRHGEIENLPVNDCTVDVIVSNCVLNLVPDKEKAFQEMYRVLQPEGHFSVSDVVLKGDLPPALKHDAEMYAGCVSGAIQLDKYMGLLEKVGFEHLSIQKEKVTILPDEILEKYLNKEEINLYKQGEFGILSITVYGKKGSTCCC